MDQKIILGSNLVQTFQVVDGQVKEFQIIPSKRHRERLTELLDTGRRRQAAMAIRSMSGSYAVLRRASQRLGKLFGGHVSETRSVMGRLVDETELFDRDLEALEDYVLEVETSILSRAERIGLEFGYATLQEFRNRSWAEAQVLGWGRLIEHQEAELIDKRWNEVEGGMELLFHFKDIHVFIANCGLGHPEIMRVPKTVQSCVEAQVWLAGDTISGLGLPRVFSTGRT